MQVRKQDGTMNEATLRADPKFSRFLEYLGDKAGQKRWASRADFDPLDIPGLLPNLWLIEIKPDKPRLLVRLTGTQVDLAYAGSLRGQFMEEIDWGPSSQRIIASLQRMADTGERHFVDFSALASEDRSVHVRRLGVPLSDDQSRMSHLLMLAFYNETFATPEHFTELWF